MCIETFYHFGVRAMKKSNINYFLFLFGNYVMQTDLVGEK